MELLVTLLALAAATAVILLALRRLERRMSQANVATLDQVNAALAALQGQIQTDDNTVIAQFTQVNADLQTLIADYKASGGQTDFTPQLQAIANTTASIQQAFTAVTGGLAAADAGITGATGTSSASAKASP
jgi:hypothetical protein